MTTLQISLVSACLAVLFCVLAWWAWRARQKRRDDDFLIGKTIIFNGQLGTITKYDGTPTAITWDEPPSDP